MPSRIAILSLCTTLPILAQERPESPGPPPPASSDVRRTVSALVGTWRGKITAAMPDAPPETFGWTMDCKEIALGQGVSCTMSGTASIGPLAQTCLVAFDPVGRAVHSMCVTSMGEVHDHDGNWTDATTLEFGPLAGTFMDEPTIETIVWRFPDPQTIETRTILTLSDGQFLRFDFRGRR
jgi:uncharacterized protein DUF1579